VRRVLAVLLLGCMAAAGCSCTSRPDPIELTGRPLDLSEHRYEDVALAMNARAERLERLWAATIVKVWYIGQEGEEQVEQLDGDLHIIQPTNIAMSLTKVGVDGAALGANERFYWYIDLLAEDPIASIGTHARAHPDRLSELGVPVHPLDLLLLLGFSKVPEAPFAELRESRNGGYLVVAAPAAWGIVEYTVDPETYEPLRVTIRRAPGQPPVLTADMQGWLDFQDRLNPGASQVRIPQRVFIDVPELDARVSIRFLEPQVSRRRPDARAFDLGDTLSRYGVRLRRDLDVVHERLRAEEQ